MNTGIQDAMVLAGGREARCCDTFDSLSVGAGKNPMSNVLSEPYATSKGDGIGCWCATKQETRLM